MNVVAIGFCFLVALVSTLARGAGAGFVYAYLPALLLFSTVDGLPILGLPDPTPPTAAIYGILGGAVLSGRRARLRLVSADYVFLLLLVAYVASAIQTEFVYTGVSIFGSLLFEIVAPYFIARVALEQRATQREALVVLVVCSLVIAFFALIEFRLFPSTYARVLTNLGLRRSYVNFAFSRFGFFRASSSFIHPIDLGTSSALVLATMAILAVRSGVGTRLMWVRVGLCAAAVAWFTAASFTSYLGFAAGLGLFLLLAWFPFTRRYLVAGVLAAIVIGFVYAGTLANAPLGERSETASQFSKSLWIRHLIIQEAWQTASGAGPFGWGRLVQVGDLESIDNAYLVIAIQRGWLALALWLALPVALASLVARSLRRARSPTAIRAVLLGFCGTFGAMVAMFTVWLGFAYQSLFVVVVALTVNAAETASRPMRARERPLSPVPVRLARSG
jgi:hypothetical protein